MVLAEMTVSARAQRRDGAHEATPAPVLPIIDLGPLLHGDRRARRRVADDIGAAAREVGFFYIANHGVDRARIDAAYRQAEAFFALPLARKLEYYIAHSRHHRGYVPVTERGDYADEAGERHYEAFDSALELPAHEVRGAEAALMGPNVWPDLRGFRAAVSGYYQAASALAGHLYRAFEGHLGLPPGYFARYTDRPTSQLRLLHYLDNDAPAAADDMNMGAHTDYECFTILHQAAPGLQVRSAAGRWQDVPPVDGTFVINIGDLLEVWTNGAFRSTLHRVVNTGRERFSMPFFAAANYDALIRPLDTMVSAARPRRYSPLVAGHHLMGQLLRDFGYLRARYQANRLRLDFEVPDGNPFERSKFAGVRQAA